MWWPYLVTGSLRMRDALLVDRANERVRSAAPPRRRDALRSGGRPPIAAEPSRSARRRGVDVSP